jgi:hypothetical protein
MLFTKLSRIAKHEVPFELRHRDLSSFDPHPKRAVLERQFIILSPVEQWLNALLQRLLAADSTVSWARGKNQLAS